MATTTRGFRFPGPNDIPDVPKDLGFLAADIDGMFISGAVGSRPAAGKVGREHYDPATGLTTLDIGTAWVLKGASDLVRTGDTRLAVQAAGTPSIRAIGTTGTTAAAGDDPRIPTQAENDALAGTSGSPSNTNRFATNADPRLTVQAAATASVRSLGEDATDAAPGTDRRFVPIGTVVDWVGNGNPSSTWFVCDGRAVSRTTYAALFAIIGSTYGAGDGTTTFNLPDFRGRVGVGALNGGSAAGAAAAASNRSDSSRGTVQGLKDVTLTAAQSGMPAHNHSASSGAMSANASHNHGGSTAAGQTGAMSTNASHNHGGSTGGGNTGGMSANNPHTHGANGGGSFFKDGPGDNIGLVQPGNGYNKSSETASRDINHVHSIPGLSIPSVNIDHSHGIPGLVITSSNIDHTHTITVNNATALNASSAHENEQPSLGINKIIRVL